MDSVRQADVDRVSATYPPLNTQIHISVQYDLDS